MKLGEFLLEFHMKMRVSADIARAARACAHIVQRVFHSADHNIVLAHAQIVVRTPHGDGLGTIVPVKAPRVGISAFVAKDIDKDAVTALFMEAINRGIENLIVIHNSSFFIHADCPFVRRFMVRS